MFQRSAKVKVADVGGAETGIDVGDGRVYKAFDGGEVGCGAALIAGEVDEVAAHGQSGAMCFGLVQADIAHQSGIRRDLVFGNLVFGNERHRVRACGHSGTNSVDEATELVGEGGAPDCCLACLHQVSVLE